MLTKAHLILDVVMIHVTACQLSRYDPIGVLAPIAQLLLGQKEIKALGCASRVYTVEGEPLLRFTQDCAYV